MKKRYLIIGTVVVLLAILYISKNTLLQNLADYLIVEEDFQKSDVLIVLGGEKSGERTKRAVELYEQGYAEQLLFSDGTELSWRTRTIDEMVILAKQLGVPDEDIYKEEQSTSTYENAVYSEEIVLENNWDSAIVVTTDWHTKRTRFTFDKVFSDSGVEITYAKAPDERIDSLNDWWKSSEKQQIVLTEWAKMIIYWVQY